MKYSLRITFFTFLFLALFSGIARANSSRQDEQVFVAMRMIGHKILLSAEDSTTLVLPVIKEGDKYKLELGKEFSFDPDFLAQLIDSVIERSRLASTYIVEVKDCDSGNVVYSYQVGRRDEANFIPCKGRVQPTGCYLIYLDIIMPYEGGEFQSVAPIITELPSNSVGTDSNLLFSIFILFLVLLTAYILFRNFSRNKSSHLIEIGSFKFDRRKMLLVQGKDTQQLTGKETDLLQLLIDHLNATVDRDILLKEVWRDEGAYIGRTLDVYVSKLRKKFDSDPAINIINVRGVGYKMTVD